MHRWLSYERLPDGVQMRCETERDVAAYAAVTFPLPGVVRLRLRPGPLGERTSEMLAPGDSHPPPVGLEAIADGIALSTSLLTVHLAREPWQLRVHDAAGAPVFAEQIADRLPGGEWAAAPLGWQQLPGGGLAFREAFQLTPDEALFGLGAHPGPLNRRGQSIRCLEAPGPAACTIPFLWSTAGYGLFVHSYCPASFDLGVRSPASGTILVAEDELDLFVIYGPQPGDILRRYAALTGPSLVPPPWAFGVWIGQAGDADQWTVMETCATLRGRHLPCDAVHVEQPWSPRPQTGGSSLVWDAEAFPAPAQLVAELRQMGFRIGLSVSPAVPRTSSLFAEGQERGFLLGLARDGRRRSRARRGQAPALVDLSRPEVRAWWQERVGAALPEGVAALIVTGDDAIPAGQADDPAGRGRYPLLCHQALREALRAGGGEGVVAAQAVRAGSQAMAIAWDEPAGASPAHMMAQLQRALSLGLSGLPLWMGCSGDCQQPALCIRWSQLALLSALARLQGPSWQTLQALGWEAEGIVRRYARLRNSLVPYLYSTAVAAAQSGLPLMRPLILEYPHDRNTWGLERQYLLGESLLVAPTWEEGEVELYLPAGQWVDYWTDAIWQGPAWIRYPAPLARQPLLVRAGAIIPRQPPSHHVEGGDPDLLILDLYPQAGGRFVLYDRRGGAQDLALVPGEEAIELQLSTPRAAVEAVLHAVPRPRVVSVDGAPAPYDWHRGRARVTLGSGRQMVYRVERG